MTKNTEEQREAVISYERVAQIVTDAFNRYHRGEHSDPVFIEHDIADGLILERRRLRGEVTLVDYRPLPLKSGFDSIRDTL